MKKLSIDLSHDIETITVSEFRKSPGEVFIQVSLGKTFIITKNNKEFAVIQKLPGDTLAILVDSKGNIKHGLVAERAKNYG